jgi:hypothetical protein
MGWHLNDLTLITGSPVGGWRPGGYVFEAQCTQHVTYVGTDEHIHELWWDGTQHVTYAGRDSHVYELWWDSNGWHYNDLTAAMGAPLAQVNRDASGYVFPSGETQHVNYLGLDNHIHELWWDNSGWHHNDLTAIMASPASTAFGPAPTGYVFAGTRHVNYLGSDNHIRELWWDSGGWHHSDLTSAAGAAATVYAEPRGHAFETQGTQHVIYMDDNGHVVELYWTP